MCYSFIVILKKTSYVVCIVFFKIIICIYMMCVHNIVNSSPYQMYVLMHRIRARIPGFTFF